MRSDLANLLAVFDVRRVGEGRYVGGSDPGDRDLVDGSQLLAQAVVAASGTCPGRVVRRADASFVRRVTAHEDIAFTIDVVQAGRTFTTARVTVAQGDRSCALVTLLLDVPGPDVVRHPVQPLDGSPEEAIPFDMPLPGRELRLLDLRDPNDPDDIGPPELSAWVRYDPVPERDDLARALLAHFTGHLSISATLRAHAGIGTAMSHRTVSTAPLAIGVSFHEPVRWSGWLRYDHESTYVGAGTSYVRGQVRDGSGRLLASFTQDAMIRDVDATAATMAERARL